MKTHLVIEFDAEERAILAVAGRSLGVAFPQIHEPTTVKGSKRPDDQREPLSIIAMGDRRAQATWSHTQVAGAAGAMTVQVQTLERESQLDHWVTQRSATAGQAILPSSEPTSAYQQYRTLAEIRGGQLRDAREALTVLMTALERTAPLAAS